MSDLLKIRRQKWSSLLDGFMICDACKVVDREMERIRRGYPCPRCGTPSEAGTSYFPLSVPVLIDMIQEFYHTKKRIQGKPPRRSKDHMVAIVIFFCSLIEVVLQHFLEERMLFLAIPYKVQLRLLNDHLYVPDRVQKLFPSLTDQKWNDTVKRLSAQGALNYVQTVEFCLKVSKQRNMLLHRGYPWGITKKMAVECIEQIWPLLNLFVALHNEFCVKDVPSS